MLRTALRVCRSSCARGSSPLSIHARSAQSAAGAAERKSGGVSPVAAAVAGLGFAGAAAYVAGFGPWAAPVPVGETSIVNWSNTHEVSTKSYFQPESVRDLEKLVAWAHSTGQKIRPVGNGLSPNGIGFEKLGMVNIGLCDKILSFDKEKGRLTVEAGARLQVVLDELRRHGWTLQNLASIKEQQVGGWIQAGCHGTGAGLPPVEDQVVAMKLITPARGTVELSEEKDPRLFRLAKCGLGALGVVSEVTLQAVRIEPLAEQTTVQTLKQVRANHARALQQNRHLRYMWIPYTDAVVVVTVNPLSACPRGVRATDMAPDAHRLEPLVALLRKVRPDVSDGAIQGMNFADLRDMILAADPLNVEHVKRANAAEAEFWKRSQGWRVGDNESLLGFECGGEQWVSECAFPIKSQSADITFIEETAAMIRDSSIPAHAPIEQRWTATSTAAMSPASAADTKTVHSWVGIIMYLPTQDPELRRKITDGFSAYRRRWQDTVQSKYGAVDHWAKVEIPRDAAGLAQLRARMARRFPVEEFNAARRELDPKGILANEYLDALFPLTGGAAAAAGTPKEAPRPAAAAAAKEAQQRGRMELMAGTVASNDPASSS